MFAVTSCEASHLSSVHFEKILQINSTCQKVSVWSSLDILGDLLKSFCCFDLDIDECELQTDNCAADAKCNNTQGGFECICNPGFMDELGDGTSCLS